jgi:glycosyltransferase involved in cell wall biosynthesis
MWQARHHLLSRMAARCEVAWMSPGPEWREALREGRPRGLAADVSGLQVYDAPRWLPRFHGSPRLDRLTLGVRLRAARTALLSKGVRRVVLYLWRPEYAIALGAVPHDLSCYHMDDEYSFSPTEVGAADGELALIQEVGQVFIHSNTLLAAKGSLNPHTAHLPNGVDYERYATPAAEPEDLARIPHPRIGYCGWLKSQLDWDLLLALARTHKNMSFVFVGPRGKGAEVQTAIEAMDALPNVHFLGARPTSVLHAYTQHFDVCLMPYKRNWYTQFIYPVKVHEYLATGNPVVASPLPNLAEFADVVTLADEAEEWTAAVEEALATRHLAAPMRARRAVASRHDWNALATRAVSIFEQRLTGGVH